MEHRNRFWRLNSHPLGNDFASALSLEEGPVPRAADGQVVIAGEYLSLDAGTRMWMSARTDGYQPPLPLGSQMVGLVLGRITESRHSSFPVGKLVRAFGQWADYSCVEPVASGLMIVDDTVSDAREHLGSLGLNAWTALIGLTEVAKTRPGETVLVSAAAGSTGMLAVQIAKIMGCRVIGIAGGAAKCAFLSNELAVDEAIDYKAPNLESRLAAIPGGIEVYFDNVGGPLLDTVLPYMAHYGRVAISGLISGYSTDDPVPLKRFDQVLMRRLTISGVFTPDYVSRAEYYDRVLRRWFDQGRLRMHFDMTTGLGRMLEAYGKLFTGGNLGKVILAIDRDA